MFIARVNSLTHQKYDIQYRLAKLTKRLEDLQSYATMVGKGQISIGDLLNSPSSMGQRALAYLFQSSAYANQYVQLNAPFMQQMYGQQMAQMPPENAQQMNAYIQRMLWEQAREKCSQIEAANIHAEEKKLLNEKERLQTLAQSIEDELKSAKEARDAGLKDFAPKYVAQA